MGTKKINPFKTFILTSSILYLFWYLFYEYFITKYTGLDIWIVNNIIDSATYVLDFFGHRMTESFTSGSNRTIGIDGAPFIFVGDPCNGFSLFALFTIFIIAFPSKVKHKIWFIPFGILTVHAFNVFRVIGLCLLALYNPNYLDFNHDYTFQIIVYIYVGLLGYIWINKFSNIADTK